MIGPRRIRSPGRSEGQTGRPAILIPRERIIPKAVDGSLSGLAQEGFELGEGILDGVELGL